MGHKGHVSRDGTEGMGIRKHMWVIGWQVPYGSAAHLDTERNGPNGSRLGAQPGKGLWVDKWCRGVNVWKFPSNFKWRNVSLNI